MGHCVPRMIKELAKTNRGFPKTVSLFFEHVLNKYKLKIHSTQLIRNIQRTLCLQDTRFCLSSVYVM